MWILFVLSVFAINNNALNVDYYLVKANHQPSDITSAMQQSIGASDLIGATTDVTACSIACYARFGGGCKGFIYSNTAIGTSRYQKCWAVMKTVTDAELMYDPNWSYYVSYIAMQLETLYTAGTLLHEITSTFSDDARSMAMTLFVRPNWPFYSGDIYEDGSVYGLSRTRAHIAWQRICPRNGGFTSVTRNDDGTFDFNCATLQDDVSVIDCVWSDFLNAFHDDFSANCANDGVMRGLQSYYSSVSEDTKFKLYCCGMKVTAYTANPLTIKVRSGDISSAAGQSLRLSLTLCWNDHVYQGIIEMDTSNTWFSTVDVVEYDLCGSDATSVTIHTNENAEIVITDVAVEDDGVIYDVNAFKSSEDSVTRDTITNDGSFDVSLLFPDDYLISCVANGCTGDLISNLDNLYLISITPCKSSESVDGYYLEAANKQTLDGSTATLSYIGLTTDVAACYDACIAASSTQCKGLLYSNTGVGTSRYQKCYSVKLTNPALKVDANWNYYVVVPQSDNSQIGTIMQLSVILRGLKGNFDKEILTGPTFDELPIGSGDIGDLTHISIEHESGNDYCIKQLTVYDALKGTTVLDKKYFADGIILSDDCGADGLFRNLAGIHYVPCYDVPLSITTYQNSLYTSIQIHSCAGPDGGILSQESHYLTLSITGQSKNDKFVTTEALSLKSSNDWSADESRDYTLPVYGEFDSIALISITNNDISASLCIDSVFINGENAFLTHYWVGPSGDSHSSISTISAVLQWPICNIELTTTITSETKLPLDPDVVATATCVNRNRLLSVDCQVSQSFETYEEVSWEHESGNEITQEVAMERGTSTSMSQGVSIEASVGVSVDLGPATIGASLSVAASFEQGREWSSALTSSKGITNLEVTTDGKVDGKTNSIECSGSVSVPPSQMVHYTLLLEEGEAKLSTLTDIKLTKCSAYLSNEGESNPNNYIYIYGIKGELSVKDATNCYVAFDQSTQVSAESITCAQERALATREWGTYVPQCDDLDPTKYKECQCAFGDSLTLPTCGCVDATSGNLIDTGMASVVTESDTYKWTDWCTANCGSGSHSEVHNNVYEAAKVPPVQFVFDHGEFEASENTQYLQVLQLGVFAMVGIMVAMIAMMVVYATNSCKNRAVNKYQPLYANENDEDNVADAI